MLLPPLHGVHSADEMARKRMVAKDRGVRLRSLVRQPPSSRPRHLSLVFGLHDEHLMVHLRRRIGALREAIQTSDLLGDRALDKLLFGRARTGIVVATWGHLEDSRTCTDTAWVARVRTMVERTRTSVGDLAIHGLVSMLARDGIELEAAMAPGHQRALADLRHDLARTGAITASDGRLQVTIAWFTDITHIGLWHRMMRFFVDYDEPAPQQAFATSVLPAQLVLHDLLFEHVRPLEPAHGEPG